MQVATRHTDNPKSGAMKTCVAVIITCYNYGSYLPRAIDSALAQTHKPTQVIVVDDGSLDATAEICAGYGDQIIYLHQANAGISSARNLGIRSCSSEYVMCLDADDWIEPTYIDECLNALDLNPYASIAYTAIQEFGLSDEVWFHPVYDFGRLLAENLFAYSALYKRAVWEEVGGYRVNLCACEDWDFWIAAGGLGHFGVGVPRPLFHYRRNTEGLFHQLVLNHLDERYREIVLNNAHLYPIEIVAKARNGEAIDRSDWQRWIFPNAAMKKIRQARTLATSKNSESLLRFLLTRSFFLAVRTFRECRAALLDRFMRYWA